MAGYKYIFDTTEAALISFGSQNVQEKTIRDHLGEYKQVGTKTFCDSEYFRILMIIPFYSGFRAETVNKKLEVITGYFNDFKKVAEYDAAKVAEILNDPRMIRHSGKINATVKNARAFKAITVKHGTFQQYIDSFSPKTSLENLMRLREDLQRRFSYLGKITAYHFLTDIGMDVLKPDRVIRRIFFRLGLLKSEGETEKELLDTVFVGHKFAEATGYPIRYIDIVFVGYGQVRSSEIGIQSGICLKDEPQCKVCPLLKECKYPHKDPRGRTGPKGTLLKL